MLRDASIESVSATSSLPASGSTAGTQISLGDSQPLDATHYSVDPAFLDNLKLQLVAGRNFDNASFRDTTATAIVNATAADRLGFESPSEIIGSIVTVGNDEAEVIGVVQDYNYDTMTGALSAMVWRYIPESFRYANVRIAPGSVDQGVDHIESVWTRLDPVHEASYEVFTTQLVSNPINRLMKDLFGIVGYVALLAIAISCLGLLGMAIYSVQIRVKEIGIRKVLGASRAGIVYVLSKDYLRLILVATIVITPLAGLFTNFWLQGFASHVDVTVWLLLACVLLMMLVATGVIASQTIRAAGANPIKSLRYE